MTRTKGQETPDHRKDNPDTLQVVRQLLQRERLLQGLMKQGHIRSPEVEESFRAVDRSQFLRESLRPRCYEDVSVVTARRFDGLATSSSTAPGMMAEMIELSTIRPGQRVLEIGTGTGFNAAILARLTGSAGAVYTLESRGEIFQEAKRALLSHGASNVVILLEDGARWNGNGMTFDRILSTADAWPPPANWLSLLGDGGILVAPIGGFIHRLVKNGDQLQGSVERASSFMPLEPSPMERRRAYDGFFDGDARPQDYGEHANRGFVLQTVRNSLEEGVEDWFHSFEPASLSGRPLFGGSSNSITETSRGGSAGELDGLQLFLSLSERRRFARVEMADPRRGFTGRGFGILDIPHHGAAFLVDDVTDERRSAPDVFQEIYWRGCRSYAGTLAERIDQWRLLNRPPCGAFSVEWNRGGEPRGEWVYAVNAQDGHIAYELRRAR